MFLAFQTTCSNCTKTFLASCIPNLQLDALPVKFNVSNLEVNPNETEITVELVISAAFTCPSPSSANNGQDMHPIVVIKLVVNVSSENLNSKQLFPTPAMQIQVQEPHKKNRGNRGYFLNIQFDNDILCQTGMDLRMK